MIDWYDVRYVLAVARVGSVRAAAERLGVNHATVFRRVARLEERLGARLFDGRHTLLPNLHGMMGPELYGDV